MKPETSQLEILMFTNTSVSKRQLAEIKSEPRNPVLSPAEELEKQCWTGLLSEVLPETILSFRLGCKNYIWSIIAERNFIRISIGPYPQPVASQTALDPNLPLPGFLMN